MRQVDFEKRLLDLDAAVYLPAVSAVYSNHIGNQRYRNFVPKDRLPFPMEKLNFLNKRDGAFWYPWALYSAGHAKITLEPDGSTPPAEDIWINRDPRTTVLGDSGGFQIAMGKWVANWDDPNCPKAKKYRETVLSWLERTSDYAMVLDVPTWGPNMNYNVAVAGTTINNDYFLRKSTGSCKFLNVLQGDKSNTQNSINWYNAVKHYCDPKTFSNHFQGWSFAGSNARCSRQILLRLIDIIHDDLMQAGKHDWLHILGYSTLEWGILCTAIQRSLRKHVNADVTVSYDSASPFIQVSKASIYTHTSIIDKGKWSFGSRDGLDNKDYSHRATQGLGNTPFFVPPSVSGVTDFESSPISDGLNMGDVCWYAPGEQNKQGKVGKSSWDTFAYILQMGHNTHHHIKGLLDGIDAYYNDSLVPNGLIDPTPAHKAIEEVVDAVLSAETKSQALDYMRDYDRFIRQVQDNNFAPKDLADHIKADTQTAHNKDKTFSARRETRKDLLKAKMNEDWF